MKICLIIGSSKQVIWSLTYICAQVFMFKLALSVAMCMDLSAVYFKGWTVKEAEVYRE